jgi:hypothetical protein
VSPPALSQTAPVVGPWRRLRWCREKARSPRRQRVSGQPARGRCRLLRSRRRLPLLAHRGACEGVARRRALFADSEFRGSRRRSPGGDDSPVAVIRFHGPGETRRDRWPLVEVPIVRNVPRDLPDHERCNDGRDRGRTGEPHHDANPRARSRSRPIRLRNRRRRERPRADRLAALVFLDYLVSARPPAPFGQGRGLVRIELDGVAQFVNRLVGDLKEISIQSTTYGSPPDG